MNNITTKEISVLVKIVMKLIISERVKNATTHEDGFNIEYYRKVLDNLENNNCKAFEIFDLIARVYSELRMPPQKYEEVFKDIIGVSLDEYSSRKIK